MSNCKFCGGSCAENACSTYLPIPTAKPEAVTVPDVNAGIEDWDNCSRKELISVIDTQRTKIAELMIRISELECSIILKGWWCMYCDIFNGEEKEKHDTCRKCEKPKHVRPPRHA